MSLTYPDKVQVTNITRDATHGTQTEGVPFTSKAYVEEESQVRYNAEGAPVEPYLLVILPKGTTIAMGDKVQITELHGKAPTTDEARERFVRRAPRVGGGSVSHVEVLI